MGNRLVQTQTLPSGTTTQHSYAYDWANRLLAVDGVAYSWDANGNLLSDGSSSYSYNAANRMTGATVGGVASSYAYDGLGNRVAQTVGGVETRYVLDVAGGLPEVISATSGGSTTRYVQVQGQVLGQYETGTWHYVLPDHLGSVRQLVDGAGGLELARSYTPFGEELETSGAGASAFGFTGEQLDATGLLFLRARYYEAGTGRFVSKDTWAGDEIMPQSLHLFSYVHNNPVAFVDPTGWYRCNDGLNGVIDRISGRGYQAQCIEARDRLDKQFEDRRRLQGSMGLELLIGLFTDNSLPGDNAVERLDFVLWYTNNAATSNHGYHEIANRYTHFRVTFDDSGFRDEFRDSTIWPDSSNQVGHFLTSAHLGARNILLECVIGHELISDKQGTMKQCAQGMNPALIKYFIQAVQADQGIYIGRTGIVTDAPSRYDPCRAEEYMRLILYQF